MIGEIKYYFAVFFRRFHYFLLIFLSVSAGAIYFASILPPVFVADASLLVEPSQIPDELAAPTIDTTAIEELQIVEQRLMTRTNLLEIARNQDVFADLDQMTADEIVKNMRENTSIDPTSGFGIATLMNLSFESENGQTAADVVNEYVSLLLQYNVESRQDRAGETLKFFEVEVDRLNTELEVQSAVVLDFNNANAGALPDTLEFRLNQQSVLLARVAASEREIFSLKEQRRRLIEIFNATGRIEINSNTVQTPEQLQRAQLTELRNELRRALAVYSTENPKVKLLQAQVSQQEAVVEKQDETVSEAAQQPLSILDINLADIDARVDLLTDQLAQTSDQLEALKATIEKTPGVAIALAALERDFSNIQFQYNGAVDRLAQAAAGERIETLSKGRRIVVLDPATAPLKPDGPKRLLISVAGIFFGGGLGLMVIFAVEILSGSIRRPADITRSLGVTPIATVPYIRTPLELIAQRAAFLAIVLFILIGVPAALLAVNTYYLPLDQIYEKIAARVGNII